MGKPNPLRLAIDTLELEGGRLVLRGAALRHVRVRRLRLGDSLVCFDDTGAEYAGRLRLLGDERAEVEIEVTSTPQRESCLPLTLAQAVLKGDHLDLVVEKATELGVVELILFTSQRTVASPSPARLARLERIAESAAKQSGRVRLPTIAPAAAFGDVLRSGALLFHPPEKARLAKETHEGGPLRLIVGPEGGFAEEEVEQARRAGCTIVGLGPRILRAETAGIAVATLAQFLWGDLGSSLA